MKRTGQGILLALGLALLTGCSFGRDAAAHSEDTKDSAAGQSAGTEESSLAPGAKGRYMEAEIELPKEISDLEMGSVVQAADKSLKFLFWDSMEGSIRCTYDGSSFTKEEEVPDLDGITASRMTLGEDGCYYYGGFDSDYQFHLWKEESGESKEVFSQVFQIPEGEDYGLIPDFLAVLQDGSLLMSDSKEAKVYLPDGKEAFTMEQEYVGVDIRTPAMVSDNTYLTLLDKKLTRYDLSSGQVTETYDIPEKKSEDWYMMAFSPDEDGGVYAANSSGLFHIGKNGTLWEQIIDGSLNSMGRQDIYLSGFFEGADKEFYGIFSGSGGMKIFRYTYDETADAVPPETLTVYSLRDNPTVRQAAAILQKNNPEVKVEFRIALQEEEDMATEDMLRALNTELLNGKGADVLILDGLPMEAYKKKGILADMRSLYEGEKEKLLPGVADDLADEDGSVFYMPARVKIPVIYGNAEAGAAIQSLDQMAAYEGNPPLFAPNIYENVVRMTAYTCYQELFGNGTVPDRETLVRLLGAVKSAGEKSGIKVSFTPEEMEKLHVNNHVMFGGFGRQSEYNLAKGKCPVGVELLNSIDSSMLTFSAAEKVGSGLSGMGKIYVPAVWTGINASSENRENAEEFMRTLFGRDVQDESLNDGFTVREDSLNFWMEDESKSEYSVSIGMANDSFTLSGSWPDKEQRKELTDIIYSADIQAAFDEQVLDLIVDGSKNYLEGKEDVETAAQAIENKLRLYEAEKE